MYIERVLTYHISFYKYCVFIIVSILFNFFTTCLKNVPKLARSSTEFHLNYILFNFYLVFIIIFRVRMCCVKTRCFIVNLSYHYSFWFNFYKLLKYIALLYLFKYYMHKFIQICFLSSSFLYVCIEFLKRMTN